MWPSLRHTPRPPFSHRHPQISSESPYPSQRACCVTSGPRHRQHSRPTSPSDVSARREPGAASTEPVLTETSCTAGGEHCPRINRAGRADGRRRAPTSSGRGSQSTIDVRARIVAADASSPADGQSIERARRRWAGPTPLGLGADGGLIPERIMWDRVGWDELMG